MEVKMEENHKLGLIVAYYLSRFDMKAVTYLGYKSWTHAFENIGKQLNVKANTIKNMRDEFDPLHPNSRKGWYKRELRPSRLEVLEKYASLSEDALIEIVKDILIGYNVQGVLTENIQTYTNSIESDEVVRESRREYTTRGITGRKAEALFMELYNKREIAGLSGEIRDTRDMGCGYDFEMVDSPYYVFEIKGLLDMSGGITFTDKEWEVAKKLGDKYFLIVISNIEDKPVPNIFCNPYKSLTPSKNFYTTIAVNWSVNSNQLF